MAENKWRVRGRLTATATFLIGLAASMLQVHGAVTPSIKVTPVSREVQLAAKATFKATMTGAGAKQGVEWLVEGVVGGNSATGVITAKGLYTAPSNATLPKQVRIVARSKADPQLSAGAVVTLALPPPKITAIYPPKVVTGWVTLRIEGIGFDSRCKVRAGNIEFTSSMSGTDAMYATAQLTKSAPATLAIVVYDPGSASRKSAPKPVAVTHGDPNGVEIVASSLALRAGESYDFDARVNGMAINSLNWYVNEKLWGDLTVGRIDEYGRYTAPDTQPNPSLISIVAKTPSATPKTGKAAISILPPLPFILGIQPTAVRPSTREIVLRGRGFLPGSKVLHNGVATTTTFYGATALGVTSTWNRGSSRKAYLQVQNPAPGSYLSNTAEVYILTDPGSTTYQTGMSEAARLLDQASFGPNEATIDRVRELGLSGWIDEQFATGESTYSNPPAMRNQDFVARTFTTHMLRGQDQLRQRMVLALGELFVVSNLKIRDEVGMVEWQRMLSANAFGNYRDLLDSVTRSPVMGRYLDLANSEKANSDGSVLPNENYARELMQLFTIGLVELNSDGSKKLDGSGNPIPTYTQTTVKELARAFTGWGYPLASGGTFTWPTPIRYTGGWMKPFETVHDTGAKTLTRGVVIPAGGTVTSDMNAVLDNLFTHPNLPPFIATRLIRHFVKSNPSPAYIQRVARVFENNGSGRRGDLKATLKATLLDEEARDATLTSEDGKLREPVLYFSAILRALQAQPYPSSDDHFATERDMGQYLLNSPTVFNYFSPMYRVGDQGLIGPEFQIYTPVTAIGRANRLFRLLNGNYDDDLVLSRDAYRRLSDDPNALLDRINWDFFRGRMSTALRNELVDTVLRQTADPDRRAMSALWLALTSGEYLVQH